jgi:hypothetical protein
MTLEEMAKRWPLFIITKSKKYGVSTLKLDTKRAIISLGGDRLLDQEISSLDNSHNLLTKSQSLQSKYSNLWFACYEKSINVWINCKGDAREYLGEIQSETGLEKYLSKLNTLVEAVSINSDIFFLCASCKEVLLLKKPKYLPNTLNLNRLLDNKESYFKWKDAKAGYYCSECVKNVSAIKSEYQLYLKIGNKYCE